MCLHFNQAMGPRSAALPRTSSSGQIWTPPLSLASLSTPRRRRRLGRYAGSSSRSSSSAGSPSASTTAAPRSFRPWPPRSPRPRWGGAPLSLSRCFLSQIRRARDPAATTTGGDGRRGRRARDPAVGTAGAGGGRGMRRRPVRVGPPQGKRHHGRRGRAHRGHVGRAASRSRTSRAPAWWWRPHNKHHGRTAADAVLLMGHTSAHEQKRPMRRRRIRGRSWVGCLLDSSG